MIRKTIALFLIVMITPPPFTSIAGTVIIPGFYGTVKSQLRTMTPTTLPSYKLKEKAGEYSIDDSTTTNKMTVYQKRSNIVVDWKTFDIGSSAWVHFDQQGNTGWTALNRIWDLGPSQIYGKLTADGKIYLINQNGILFGPSAQVNIHSLIASSLNLTQSDFVNSLLKFNTGSEEIDGKLFYDSSKTPGTVTNLGTIVTKDQGSVFLIGPTVENGGTIEANLGQIGLIAGYDLQLVEPVYDNSTLTYPTKDGTSETRTALLVKMIQNPDGAVAWNMENGSLAADQGHVGMYGGIVNQDGLVRSVTAVQRAGHVELMASQKIETGTNSRIATPVSSSLEKYSNVATYESTIVLSGIDTSRPWDPYIYPDIIELNGRIDAPGGYVELRATNRIYLASGGAIDVSGLWIDKTASDQTLTVAMTSVNMRDEFMQKNGVLKGTTITIGALTGSSIGDVSDSYSESLTAVERHTQGGDVVISLVADRTENKSTATGDFIMREGATIDFSGGGFRYAEGAANTTVLVSGNKIYDIGTAPSNIRYDKIINSQSVTNSRYGITDHYEGIYYGGVAPLSTSLPAHIQGSNAGSLAIGARQAVLDGTLDGSVEKGIYQYLAANPSSNGNQTMAGYVEPLGGGLYLGNTDTTITDNDNLDRYFTDIIVTGQIGSVLSSDFTSSSDLSQILGSDKTIISSTMLNKAGLSNVYLAANRTVTIAEDADIVLDSGKQEQADGTVKTSTFEVTARRIEHYGSITVPGGDIILGIEGNRTTNETDLHERIYLADGSILDVKGERVDNRIAINASAIRFGAHTEGGNVTILDKTVNSDEEKQEGIAVNRGALVDVSGGWLIDTSGKVSGGDAGSITLQGYSLLVDGDLRGYSLIGNNGGSVSLHAGNVIVGSVSASLPDGFTADSPWPENVRGNLILSADRFNDTGFADITLKSLTDIAIGEGFHLTPSASKLSLEGAIVRALPEDVGATSVTLSAGKGFIDLAGGERYATSGSPLMKEHNESVVTISSGVVLETPPEGSITISGPIVDVYGTIHAPSGAIKITSSEKDLTIHGKARVIAEGYNKSIDSLLANLPLLYAPVAAGSITLNSAEDLIIQADSLISVDGSAPVRRARINEGGTISYYSDGGNAGSIALSGFDITLDGVLMAQTNISGVQGGTLTITKKGSSSPLSVSSVDLEKYKNSGFDAVTLASEGELYLDGSMDVAFGRSLTLDAKTITGSGTIRLSAPWTRVMYDPIVVDTAGIDPESGNAILQLAGQFLDVTGDVIFSGFAGVYLHADRDMRFSDLKYGSTWIGSLRMAGDLTLEAARIYPTTQSVFVVETTGKTTVLPSGRATSGSIYSAGGSLTIKAGGGIENYGYIAAPMGTVSLEATGMGLGGRVYLADGSVVTTSSDLSVLYGSIDSDSNYSWIVTDRNNITGTVESAPEKSISLTGEDVIVREGSVIDISGGGEIFSYVFVPSVSGTSNPLEKANTWVILPDNSIILPGRSVYLEGITGLKTGTYSLLPAEYAFLPGAMILTDLNQGLSGAKPTKTADGYAVVAGYETVTGTNIKSGNLKTYSLRLASDVLNEGVFVTRSITSGDGGTLTIMATNTAIVDGSVNAAAKAGFSAGSLYVGGEHVVLQSLATSLPVDFNFSTDIPDEFAGMANISQSLLTDNVFGTIGLGYNPAGSGDGIVADTVTLKEGTILEAETIILGARDAITVEKGAQVLAITSGDNRGEITFSSPSGSIIIKEEAVVRASDAINIDTTDLSLDPSAVFTSDHSELNLKGPKITFVQDDYMRSVTDTGIFLTATQFSGLAGSFENIGLKSASDIVFDGDFNLSITDILTLDTGLIQGTDGGTVQLTAGTIYILNTAAVPSIEKGSSGQGKIIFTARSDADTTGGNIYIGKGTVLFDGFSSVGDVTEKGGVVLNAQNDLVFRGAGTLNTGNADFNVTASRVTTSYYMDSDTYTAADFTVDAGTGNVSMANATDRNAGNDSVSGALSINGNSIQISTLIEIPSGHLELTATENISLNEGAEIRAVGTDSTPGGDVIITSTGDGSINLAFGTSIDVSAGAQGDAGSISLYAPVGGVVLTGDIQGQAETNSTGDKGRGGSFSMVTNSLALDTVMDFSTLNTKLSEGGFDGGLNIRTSEGNITVGAEDTVRARTVKIASDAGSLSIYGNIDVSRDDQGGTAELYAKNNLIFDGYIDASGIGESSTGGDVVLAADTGVLTFNGNGEIDVSGSETGGIVSFRKSLSGADNNLLNMSLNGTVIGASGVYIDAVRTYTGYTTINASALNTIKANTTTFMNNSGSLKDSLFASIRGVNEENFHLRPGIVIANNEGDLTLNGNLDLTTWRYAGEAGTLTLRAAGNLNIDASIIDNPTNSYSTLWSGIMKDSWDINLIAGADTASADLMAINPIQNASTGNLTIATNRVVYTENGSISFASGRDTTINQGASNSYMIAPSTQYTLASYGGSIKGDVAGNLNIKGGVIQTALGDIDIDTDGDLILGTTSTGTYKGTIRTTGERAEGKAVNAYETYANGGDIYLNIGGDVMGSLSSNYWLTYKTERIDQVNHYIIIPVYGGHPTEGVATLADGDVYIKAGGSYFAQTGSFGQGDLRIYARGDMNGRFLIHDGIGELSAGANFGSPAKKPLIEMADARITVTAQGDMNINGILNPTLVKNNKVWDNGYTAESSVKLTAISGGVIVDSVDTDSYAFYAGGLNGASSYLPATVDIEAGRDIKLGSFTLMPSETGQLRLVAERDISGSITMSDADASGNDYTTYGGLWKITTTNPAPDLTMDHGTVTDENGRNQPLHYYDSEPVSIWAGRDINNMTITLPKKASIHAERDIISLNYSGMNISDSDVSRIYAGRNIAYEYSASQATESKKIEQRGPGYLAVQAGNAIDLGNSLGIITTGNSGVITLGSKGSSILVAAGVPRELEWEETRTFFDMLRKAGDEYSTLLAAGDAAGAQRVIDDARENNIAPFLGTVNESADIMMTSSQMSTQANGNIIVLAGGRIDVGRSAIGSTATSADTDKNTGIYTAIGGGINIFALGDINVNEARVMTFMGGDITMWSDEGDVNAGRGSRTAISAIPPRSYIEEINGVKTVVTKFVIPAVGSGVRAMTYDPDGSGPVIAPEPGILHVFAPAGIVDAGEAGMEGKSAFIGGVQVLNTQNMSFSQGAVGMPPQTQSVNMGALAGTGVTTKDNLSSSVEALSEKVDSKSADPTKPIAEMLQKLDVKVISYDLSLGSSPEDVEK